jgi:FlaA1/EpsC-like NDP-sugar epimerase
MADERMLPWLVQADPPDVGWLDGATVMVTGAGGAIGGELCRQLAPLWPDGRLVLVDRDDNGLYRTLMAIDRRCPAERPEVVVADITYAEDVVNLLWEHRPHVVFHAAAFKDVVLGERYPWYVVSQNVIGTASVVDAARRVGVKAFVNVSTDKAADPTSIMGASKRLAERIVAGAAMRSEGRFLSVRFGNVAGGRTSALELFAAQIDDGGPVTLTDPAVSRYWMTLSQAVGLMLTAARHQPSGHVGVLEMGRPRTLGEIAQELMHRRGRMVGIEVIGLRPGEKRHETLLSHEEAEFVRPLCDGVNVVPVAPLTRSEERQIADRLAKGVIDGRLHVTGLAEFAA